MTNNNFDEMLGKALEHIDDTLDKTERKPEPANPYKLNPTLIKEGFDSDDTGVYVPFKTSFQLAGVTDDENFATCENIYLWIGRNPDKKLEINFKWANKTENNYYKTRGFNIDFLLDIGDEKDLKALNRKVSFSGGKNHNPASKNTYVEFVRYFTDIISDNTDCLDVFKDPAYKFPEPTDTEDGNVELELKPQSFNEYPPRVQHEALQILENGDLFAEMQKSVSLTHEGHHVTRDAVLLMETSLFVDDGAHGLLGGESGEGKTDLALTCAMNIPDQYVHIISSNSPKDIFYDFESYDDKFNILVFDDILFNDELIKLCKLLTDNRMAKKVHKTVINGKAEKFELKGKYEIIITYAKELPDEELSNRLFNIGVTIIDENESKDRVKYRIRDNRLIKDNNNKILSEIREPIKASIQYLIEHTDPVYNPYLTTYDPLNFNNRDINHLVSMTNARTFLEHNKRARININENNKIIIGSYTDLMFVNDIWQRDGNAQKYKLSELQKQCLELLPELTVTEAFDYVENLKAELDNAESRAYKTELLNKEPLLTPLAKKLGVNRSTLKHSLDRTNEGNRKSLCEMGIVDKIQLDEDNAKSPNFYYKIKKDGDAPNSTSSHVQDMQFANAHVLNSPIIKQLIIINLLIYANICLSERGGDTLKKYCTKHDVELTADNYNSMIEFLQGFFDTANPDIDYVELEEATRDGMLEMFKRQRDLSHMLHENSDTQTPSPAGSKICTSTKTTENPQESQQSKNKNANQNRTCLHIGKSNIKAFLDKNNIDITIAKQTLTYLISQETATSQDIINYIYSYSDPDDFNNNNMPLKITNHLNKMFMYDLLDFNAPYYEIGDAYYELTKETQTC